jgi:hypothetical protein
VRRSHETALAFCDCIALIYCQCGSCSTRAVRELARIEGEAFRIFYRYHVNGLDIAAPVHSLVFSIRRWFI